MFDLQQDRRRVDKRHRPFAAGELQLKHAVWLVGSCFAFAAALSMLLPGAFRLSVIAYIGGAVGYSLFVRSIPALDAIALAALYGTRVWAGSAATGIALSFWLVVICALVFLSLALVRRSGENAPSQRERAGGTNIRDGNAYANLAAFCGLVAALTLAFHISIDASALYRRPELLWASWAAFSFWLGRICVLARGSRIRRDPITFSETDWPSLIAAPVSVGCWIAAF
jgi:4-hydroxybenzoate polyprenyltransferase